MISVPQVLLVLPYHFFILKQSLVDCILKAGVILNLIKLTNTEDLQSISSCFLRVESFPFDWLLPKPAEATAVLTLSFSLVPYFLSMCWYGEQAEHAVRPGAAVPHSEEVLRELRGRDGKP